MKPNRILLYVQVLVVIFVAYQLFRLYTILKQENKAIELTEKYCADLTHYSPYQQQQFATAHFLKDLDYQAQQSPVFAGYLNLFKADTEKYPLNVLAFLLRHMAIHPSKPLRVIGKDRTLYMELYVGCSTPTKVQLGFEKTNDSLRIDGIANLHLFFERLDCQRKEQMLTLSSADKEQK